MLGCFLYNFMTSINKNKININKKKYRIYLDKLISKFFEVLNIDSKMFKPIISIIIMVLLMTLLFLRTNSSISIIFIFLIIIFQNNMLKSLKDS